MSRPIGVGIVGCGGAAVDVCRAIDALPDVTLAGVHDRAEALAADLAAPRGATVHPTLEALVADPAVELVYVALPHDLLAPVAEQALLAGRHALVEKPMALDVATIQRLERLAADRSLTLSVMFEFRAAATVLEARRLIAGGAIGVVRAIRIRTVIDKPARYWQSGPSGRAVDDWRAHRSRAGGGVVLMNAIHQLDVVRFVTGLEFTRASGETATPGDAADVEATAAAALRMGNGAIASLAAAAHSPGADHEERIEIDGEHGRVDVPDPYGPGRLRIYLRRAWDDLPVERWTETGPPQTEPAHTALLRAVAAAVRSGTPPPATARDAAAALGTVLGIYASAATGRAIDLGDSSEP